MAGGKVTNILEAAFVDPAYSYPPAEGQGKHAIELQATPHLLHKVDPTHYASDDDDSLVSDGSVVDLEAAKDKAEADFRQKKVAKVTTMEEKVSYRGFPFLKCCKSAETHVVGEAYSMEEPTANEIRRVREKAARKAAKKNKSLMNAHEENKERRLRREQRKNAQKYKRVAEGILIYRLDTAKRTITLLSGPSSNTDLENLLRHMVVATATPSNDSTRRGICLTGIDGSRATLTACEQRTAIAWLEAIDMMLSQNSNNPKVRNRTMFYLSNTHTHTHTFFCV